MDNLKPFKQGLLDAQNTACQRGEKSFAPKCLLPSSLLPCANRHIIKYVLHVAQTSVCPASFVFRILNISVHVLPTECIK